MSSNSGMDNYIVVSLAMKLNDWMQTHNDTELKSCSVKEDQQEGTTSDSTYSSSRKTELVNEDWRLDGSYLEGVTGRRQKVGYFWGAANVLFLDLGRDFIGLDTEHLSSSHAYHSSTFLYVCFTSINSLLKRMYFGLPSWKQLQHLHCLEKRWVFFFLLFKNARNQDAGLPLWTDKQTN